MCESTLASAQNKGFRATHSEVAVSFYSSALLSPIYFHGFTLERKDSLSALCGEPVRFTVR